MARQALVTGGTRGIGEGISRALAAAGYQVLACGGSEAECAAFAPHPAIRTRVLDVTSDFSVAAALADVGSLDVLANCAGIIQRGGVEFDIAGFERTLAVNLVGTMRMCVAAKEKLAAAKGAIINIASMTTYFGAPLTPGYAASKGGVGQLTKSLAGAWAAEGIRVNAIAPGWIETPLTRALVEDQARYATVKARTPMQRWGTPSDLAGVAVFLASDAAGFITGTILPVDGGYSAV